MKLRLKFERCAVPYSSPEVSGEGVFYKSASSRSELLRYLESLSLTRFKEASAGGDEETGFEQAFSSLAYSYIKDKSPRLLDFMIGFQLVERNEDNTKAVGLFGYRVGKRWLYTPVFFLNGDMKGQELLFLKDSNTFIPLKENWVNYVISQKPHRLGEPSQQTSQQLGVEVPNLRRLIMPPGFGKYGNDSTQSWALLFLPFLGAMASCEPLTGAGFDKVFGKVASAAAQLDLGKFLQDNPEFLKTAYETYCNYPLIRQGFDKFYGTDFFRKTASDIHADLKSVLPKPVQKKAACKTPTRQKLSLTDSILGKKAAINPVSDKKVRVYVYDSLTITHNLDDLDEDDREKLLKDTVLIKDKRDPHEQSTVYNTQTQSSLINPNDSGVYEVLEKFGKFSEMIVLHNLTAPGGNRNASLVFRKDDPKANKITHAAALWVRPDSNLKREEYKDWFEGLSKPGDFEIGAEYTLVGPRGEATVPFQVRDDFGDGRLRVSFRYTETYSRPNYLPSLGKPRPKGYDSEFLSCGDAFIVINERAGARLHVLGNEVHVPGNFKVVKTRKSHDLGDHWSLVRPKEEDKKSEPIVPGNLADAQLLMYEKTGSVKITDVGGSEILIEDGKNNNRLQKRAALISLVHRYGITEPVAREMLTTATRCKVASYRVKYAFGYGPGAPAFPEAQYSTEQLGNNSVQALYPQEDLLPVPDLDSGRTDPSIYDPFYTPDTQSMQVAQQAAQSGQKEVFDTAMISGMLKTVRQESIIDRYLGPLMQALDKLGRLLFMFYWHQEEFEERYGKQDLPELEDSLRNAFETLGDVTLFLKEKSVGSLDEFGGSGVGGSEPNIAEAARN